MTTVKRAIILAAGKGSRLTDGTSEPKPLRQVAGTPLLVRVLRTLQSVGIREVVVVVGFEGERIRRVLRAEPSLGLELHFVDNPDYDKSNGVSLLKAEGFIDQECLLSMADHLYSPELVRNLLAADLPAESCALGVDYDIMRCFDLDDATKVRTCGNLIGCIGKELDGYDAIDTGVFRIGPPLVAELKSAFDSKGDCSLSDGVGALSRHGRFLATDIGDARWIDVDTPAALERAEAMLRVFGDSLGDEPGTTMPPAMDPDALELFAPSWVRAAQPYNEEHFALASSQSDVARLMSNESPYAPSPRVIDAIVEAALRGNLYPDAALNLRQKLAARERLTEKNVLLGAGSTELIDVVIRSFVSPGEEVLLSVPTFSMYEARTRVVGGIPVLVPMSDEADHDVAALIRAVTERTKVIFVCTPNNPTGNRVDLSDLRRILRLGLPTVIDEAYVEFSGHESLAFLIQEFPNAVVLRTFSKAYGLAGLRLGYALGHEAIVRLLRRVKLPWNVPATTIAAANAVLDDAAEYEARRSELGASRSALAEELSCVEGLRVIPSEGNFLLLDISATRVAPEALVDKLLQRGVLIRSLSVHHASRRYVRVSVGSPRDNARCVAAFAAVLGSTQPSPRVSLQSAE